MEKLFQVQRVWQPRVFGIEAVAYQKAFKYFLKDECERRQIYLRVKDIKVIGRKEYRIRGLQPIMAAGRLYLHGGASLLRNQMSEFPLGEHDDVLDSLAMHLQMMSGQLSPETVARRQREVQHAVSKIIGVEDVNNEFWADLTSTRYSGGYDFGV